MYSGFGDEDEDDIFGVNEEWKYVWISDDSNGFGDWNVETRIGCGVIVFFECYDDHDPRCYRGCGGLGDV